MDIRLNKNNIPVETFGRVKQKIILYLRDWESLYHNADKEVSSTEYSLRLYIEDLDIAPSTFGSLAGWKCVRKRHFYYLLLTSPKKAAKKNKELVLEFNRPRFTDTEEPNKFGKVSYQRKDKTLKTKEFALQITKKKRKMYPLTPNVHGNIITGQNYENSLQVYLLNTGTEDLKFTTSSRLKISYYTDASEGTAVAKPDAVATGAMKQLKFVVKTSTGVRFKKPRVLMASAPKVDCFTTNFAPAKNVELKPNEFIQIEITKFITNIHPRTGLLYAEVNGLDNEDNFRLPIPIMIVSPNVEVKGNLKVKDYIRVSKITTEDELVIGRATNPASGSDVILCTADGKIEKNRADVLKINKDGKLEVLHSMAVKGGFEVVNTLYGHVPLKVKNEIKKYSQGSGSTRSTHASYTGVKVDSLSTYRLGEEINILDLVPIGTIVMWNKKSIPAGWAICDGNNGTPNLTNRFVAGVGEGRLPQNNYGRHSLGSNGGSEIVWLYPKHIPEHLGYPKTCSGTGCSKNQDIITVKNGPNQNKYGSAIDIRPPFYAMYYIMRVK